MSARRMERRGEGPQEIDAAEWVRVRLRRPDRLLVLGWPDAPGITAGDAAAGGTAEGAQEICTAERPGEARPETFPAGHAGEGPFSAVIWRTTAGEVGTRDLRQVRDWLRLDGRLALLAAFAGAGDGDGAAVRRLEQILAEVGFVIQRIDEVDLGGANTTRTAALLARRDPYVIRSYQDGDDRAIAELFRHSFHTERRAEHWRWKYHVGPWGGRMISLAFGPGGELAAHYAGYPVPFWTDDGGERSFLGLQMGDTMTHPGHRAVGRGSASLLARTVRHFFALHRSGRLGFYYGFNTGPIRRFCDWFLGGSQADAVCYRVRELDPSPPWTVLSRTARVYRTARVDTFGTAFDRLFRRVAPSYRFLVRRDAEYLRWRYLDCPDAGFVVLAARRWGRLVGWSVFRRRDEAIVWGDALFDPRHARAAEAVLAAALRQPELAGTTHLEGWFPNRPRFWDEELVRLGFEVRPQKDDLAIMFLPDTETDIGDRLRNLYYTMGDGDLF